MADMSKDDYFELERRRLIESVTDSIEHTLRRRYTWLAIVISFLIGGGVATTVLSLTGTAKRKLVETEILLDRAKSSIEAVDNLSSTVKSKYGKLEKELDGLFEVKTTMIDRQNEALYEIKRIDLELKTLKTAINSSINNGKIDKNLLVVSPQQAKEIKETLKKLELSKFMVYLHYENEENKKLTEKLGVFLRKKGFIVPDIRQVDYKLRDIRYFHDEDQPGVTVIQNYVNEFINKYTKIQGFKLKIKDLGEAYPKARKGLIEVWIYF